MKNIFEGNYKLFLVVPIVLFIVFGLLAANVEKGMDLTGGNLVSIQLGKEVGVEGLDAKLSSEFTLKEVIVTKVTSPLGTGIMISFSENTTIAGASADLSQAQDSLTAGDSSMAEVSVSSALSKLEPLIGKRELTGNTKEIVHGGFAALADAKEEFNDRLTAFIQKELGVVEFSAISFQTIGPSLGEAFMEQARNVLITAFILMIFVIIFFFRDLVPSAAIILAAIFDVLTALAAMSIFGFPLTLATITALLMLVGYSVDTDIMLTTRLLKRREHTAAHRTKDAMTTGLTMTGTTLSALTVLFIISYLTQMGVVMEIAFVLLAGLFGDLVSTWMMNAPMLLWYVERKRKIRV